MNGTKVTCFCDLAYDDLFAIKLVVIEVLCSLTASPSRAAARRPLDRMTATGRKCEFAGESVTGHP